MFLILVIVTLFSFSTAREIVIESQNITNWGKWGPWDRCPNGTFASGFQLKTERKQTSSQSDDTGLNGIKLFCSKSVQDPTWIGEITSSVGEWGEWGIKFRCDMGQFIQGFELKSLSGVGGSKSGSSSWFGAKDDYGATNLQVYCSPLMQFKPMEGDGLEIGTWGRLMKCFNNQRVCAIRTQVEFNDKPNKILTGVATNRWVGFGDFTALNNVRMKCCDIPNEAKTCKPSDEWETVLSCDATYRTSPFTCKYNKKIGVSNSKKESQGMTNSQGDTVGMNANVNLAANFAINYSKSKTTGNDWRHESSSTFNSETVTTSEFTVQPGQLSVMKQVVGKCGDFVVHSMYFKIQDYDANGNLIG